MGREAHAEAMRREAANYFQSSKQASGYDDVVRTKGGNERRKRKKMEKRKRRKGKVKKGL